MNADFEPFFGHKLATGGEFIRVFEFSLDDLIAVVRKAPLSDIAVGMWFIEQPGVTPERIATWNDDAFDLGKPGQPMSRAFSWVKRKYYDGENADPAVVSVFSGIA